MQGQVSAPNPPQSPAPKPFPSQPASERCGSCGKPIEPADKFCRHCGRRQDRGAVWYYQPTSILLLSLAVLGPFGLILVWKAPRISRTAKWILAAVILVYSLWVMWWCWRVVIQAVQQLGEIANELKGIS